MPRDILKAIREFFQQFQNLQPLKITPKSLSDACFFMQFLSNIDCRLFDTSEMHKPPQQTQKNKLHYEFHSISVKTSPPENHNKELDLMLKMKNWKILIKKVKEFFSDKHQKGIKYADIDFVDISKNAAMEEISKVFELLLCVVANCDLKEELISKIMQLQESTQSTLALTMQEALETRLCSLETQERMDLLEELQLKQQEVYSLYGEIQKLQQLNSEYLEKIQEYEKSAHEIEYEKQKIRRFNKKNSFISSNSKVGSSSIIDRSHEDSYQLEIDDGPYLEVEESFSFHNVKGGNKIIESLKNKLLREEEEHENQVEELHEKIYLLEEQLKERAHFEELLVIYQEKYQQALAYVEKVSQYEKQKNKIYQEIIEKDIIIEELKSTIGEINERLIEVEEQKIDLQLLLAKKNSERLAKHNLETKKDAQNKAITIQREVLFKTTLPTLKKHQSTLLQQSNLSKTHTRQISQQMNRNQVQNRISLGMYAYLDEQDPKNCLEELQIKTESQSLEIKRLKRKEKELAKHNAELKAKLEKMRRLENQNKKLSNIIVELHTRKNEETEILVSCLHETFVQYDFKFHKLIGDNFIHGSRQGSHHGSHYGGHRENQHENQHVSHDNVSQIMMRRASVSKSQFNDVTNMSGSYTGFKISGFNATFSSEMCSGKRKEKRNPSIRVQSEKQILEVSINKQCTQLQLS